uniref:Uncharacterized protein n=1 Tax=Anguilla anguilla TaxID=7936 RepID=A0A0E9VRJ0_ANGAN
MENRGEYYSKLFQNYEFV